VVSFSSLLISQV